VINWTNHDRHALDEWLMTDLGRKFLAYLEQEKPPFPEETDLTSFALTGAIMKGYSMLLEKINGARNIVVPPVPPVRFIDTSDNPVSKEQED
jgi:hypothetical protein